LCKVCNDSINVEDKITRLMNKVCIGEKCISLSENPVCMACVKFMSDVYCNIKEKLNAIDYRKFEVKYKSVSVKGIYYTERITLKAYRCPSHCVGQTNKRYSFVFISKHCVTNLLLGNKVCRAPV